MVTWLPGIGKTLAEIELRYILARVFQRYKLLLIDIILTVCVRFEFEVKPGYQMKHVMDFNLSPYAVRALWPAILFATGITYDC
jgi:hypothetical protein